jgi:hypothetical protein
MISAEMDTRGRFGVVSLYVASLAYCASDFGTAHSFGKLPTDICHSRPGVFGRGLMMRGRDLRLYSDDNAEVPNPFDLWAGPSGVSLFDLPGSVMQTNEQTALLQSGDSLQEYRLRPKATPLARHMHQIARPLK